MFEVDKNGEMSVKVTCTLPTSMMKNIIHKIVTDCNAYTGEDAHTRWTTLYNAYDMVFDGDIRKDHELFQAEKEACKGISRIDYMIKVGKIGQLFYVASRIYKNEFEKYIDVSYLIGGATV